MTDITALDKLINALEAGTATFGMFGAALGSDSIVTAWDAYGGSLDAALALHEALLPEWGWGRFPSGNMWVTDDTDDPHRFLNSDGYFKDNQPRAWLLAILKAYRGTLA